MDILRPDDHPPKLMHPPILEMHLVKQTLQPLEPSRNQNRTETTEKEEPNQGLAWDADTC